MLSDMLKVQLDVMGAQAEVAAEMFGERMLSRISPRTDRNLPVITLPGLMASDASFKPLNRFLNRQGFNARPWSLGRNRGLQGDDWKRKLAEIERHLADQIKEMSDESSAPVSLVGHSMGGIYARELALRMENEIDRVITLAAPTLHPYRNSRHNQLVMTVSDLINRQRAAELGGRDGLLHWDPDRPAMPCVAIHSPIDALVDEEQCCIPSYIVAQSAADCPRENIRVLSSHVGMSVNPFVMLAVADRLLADRNNWRPFDSNDYFPVHMRHVTKMFYPEPAKPGEDRGMAAFIRPRP